MKKITFVAILALAFTSFACGDDKKDDSRQNEEATCVGTNEEIYKCYDKKSAQKILACADADNSVSINDNREDLENQANGTEDYSYLDDPRYSRCLTQILAYSECEAQQSCEELLAHWKDSSDDSFDNYGSCKDAAIAHDECITPIAERLCFARLLCSKSDEEDVSSEESQRCYDEAIAITNVACINAKRAYYECITADDKDFCETENCANELAAEQAACGSGT